MKHFKPLALAGLLLMPALALAHAHLEMSIPAANGTVAAMPAQVMLHFSEAVKMTALSIQMEGSKDKQEIKVPAEAKAVIQVDAPKLGAGVYMLNWRGMSDDGHVMNGTVRFTVSGK
jgi:methionine-rich copper-binding protein CopC